MASPDEPAERRSSLSLRHLRRGALRSLVGFLAALLQAEDAGLALREGPAAGRAALLRLPGRRGEVWPRLLGGLLLAAPLGPVAFLRVREADREDPGTSPQALRIQALTAPPRDEASS